MKTNKIPKHISRPDLLRNQQVTKLREVDIKDGKVKFVSMGEEPKRKKV